MVKKIMLTVVTAGLMFVSALQAAEVEVIHWWTSGGEQAAVSVFAKEFNALGGDQWVDTAIAGGENARSATMQRVLGGDPPEAAQFNISRQFEELIETGKLLDLTDLAEKDGWRKFIRPSAILGPCEKDGRIWCVPVNIHSAQWMWTSKKVFADVGISEPKTWDDFLAAAPKIRAKGYIPLALGGQAWQENILFGTVLMAIGGRDLHYSVYRDKKPAAARGATMRKVFETFGKLRQYVDEGSPGRNWNDATNLVITDKAAAQVMGDWARGEFAVAGEVPGQDYNCIPGPSANPFLVLGGDIFLFPKQSDSAVEKAQLKMASMMVNPRVQALFNNAKGSLPVRDDVDFSLADACMKKGLKLLQNPATVIEGSGIFITSDTQGQLNDLITEFWNNSQMSASTALARFAAIIETAE